MKLKKMLCGVMAFCVSMSLNVFCASAFGFEITDLSAVHNFSDNCVEVSGKCYAGNKTLSVVITKGDVEPSDIGAEDINDIMVDMREIKTVEAVFSFSIKLHEKNIPSGEYKVYVFEKSIDKPVYAEFEYKNPDEYTALILEDINSADETGIVDKIKEYSVYLGIDESLFEDIPGAVSGLVLSEKPDDGFSKVLDVKKSYIACYVLAVINECDDAELAAELIEKYNEQIISGDVDYSLIGDCVQGKTEDEKNEKQKKLKENIASRIISEDYDSLSEFNEEFEDVAVSEEVSCAESIDALEKLILDKYSDILKDSKSSFEKSVTAFGKLTKKAQTNVFKALLDNKYEDVSSIASAFIDEVDVQKKESESNKSQSSSSGGGGGGGRGGSGGTWYTANPYENLTQPEQTPGKEEAVPEPEENVIFKDMENAKWALTSVMALKDKNIVSGYDGYFRPSDRVTREEFAKMLVASFGITDDSASCEFDDVKEGSWYYTYVASAKSRNIINGISDKLFGTGENLTRQDAAVMIYNTIFSLEKQGNLSDGEISFADIQNISDYARDKVCYLGANKIINGMPDGTFMPKSGITRAEAAQLLYNTLTVIGII